MSDFGNIPKYDYYKELSIEKNSSPKERVVLTGDIDDYDTSTVAAVSNTSSGSF